MSNDAFRLKEEVALEIDSPNEGCEDISTRYSPFGVFEIVRRT